MKTIIKGASILGIIGALITQATAQNQLQILSATPTVEGAITLTWASNPNEIYEIDEADVLNTNSDGSTAWNTLYSDYPSQGTSTFWLDTGNYFVNPEIVHPSQSPMRFYRIVLTGTNTAPTVPIVSISSPSNGASATGDLTVTVIAYADQAFLTTKLYVDGQEMNEPDTRTNWADGSGITNYVQDMYVLNTCEWPNGTHTLFATASCQTGATGAHDVGAVGISYGISPFVPVAFSNLITRISFTQPFFMPEDGQTQVVSAIFTANVNWTLQIQDDTGTTVRTATGSGGSMVFDWDGTGTGGTNLPVGTYTYLITAETNGLALPAGTGGDGSGDGRPPSPSFAFSAFGGDSGATQFWVESPSGGIVPLFLYPPGFDTNTLTIFEEPVSWSPYSSMRPASSASFAADTPGGTSEDYGGAPSQTSRAPKRPPINPVKGRAGVYGIAYDTYSANGNGFTIQSPDNGLNVGQRIHLEGHSGSTSTFRYPPLVPYKWEANAFIAQMKKGNWSQGFAKVDNQFTINDLRGSGTMFNTVKLGLLLLHGTYGTSQDFKANQTDQIYFPITSGHSASYIRASEMSFGNSATNGLKWMGILACNSLQHSSWSSMQSLGAVPYNSSLHLILGSDSVIWTEEHVASYWAKYMIVGKTNQTLSVESAWYAAGQDAYAETLFNYTNQMNFAASGDASCRNDTLKTYSNPGGASFYNSVKVWPLP